MLHTPFTFSKQLLFVLIYWYDVQTVQKYWTLALEYRYLPTENEGYMVLQMLSLSMESAFYVPERSISTTCFFYCFSHLLTFTCVRKQYLNSKGKGYMKFKGIISRKMACHIALVHLN